jgi:hypothetical protein
LDRLTASGSRIIAMKTEPRALTDTEVRQRVLALQKKHAHDLLKGKIEVWPVNEPVTVKPRPEIIEALPVVGKAMRHLRGVQHGRLIGPSKKH